MSSVSVYVYIAMPVIAALCINGIIFSLGWNVGSATRAKKNPYLPPGYVVGIVWVVILGILGGLLYLVQKQKKQVASYAIVALIVFCLLYPFLTAGLQSNTWSAVLNLVTLIIAFSVSIIIPRSEIVYMVPILLWATYVNVTQLLHSI